MASYSNETHRCKHCGEGIEHATGVNGGPISSDCCYGCRNRYTAAIKYMTQVEELLTRTEIILQQEEADTEGLRIGDEVARARWQSSMTRTRVLNNHDKP